MTAARHNPVASDSRESRFSRMDREGVKGVLREQEIELPGNVLVQARALGVTGGSLADLRSFVRRSVHLTRYEPDEQEAAWERADEVVLASRAPAPRSRPCSKLGETVS
jgi:hypothetical protein